MIEWNTGPAPEDGQWYLVGCWVEHEDGTREWSAWAEPLDGGIKGCDGRYGDEWTHWAAISAPEGGGV